MIPIFPYLESSRTSVSEQAIKVVNHKCVAAIKPLNNSGIILKKSPLTFLAVDGCHWHVRYEEELLGIPKGKLSKRVYLDNSSTHRSRGLLSPSVALQRHLNIGGRQSGEKKNQLLSLAIANHGPSSQHHHA